MGCSTATFDQNPIENLWGRLATDIFENGQQYATVQDLKVQIEQNVFSLKL